MGKLYRNEAYRINLVISLTVLLGFTISVVINTLTYSNIIREDIRNISKLSSTNIYSEINNELIKPIFVSLTMANDSFLKAWLEEEKSGGADADKLVEYLDGIKEKYGYNSVFMVSDETGDYYHYRGLHKTISRDDDHDQWYYQFEATGKTYDLDIDVDEADNKALTVFVNCRIEDENNNLLGVVGVGMKMDEVQGILGTFEDAYDLEAFLIDQDGLVQVHTSSRLIETYNVRMDETISGFMEDIISNKSTLETYRYNENGIDGYLITRYVDDLEWYLMVKKDTSILKNTLYSQIAEVFFVVLLVILAVVFFSNSLIKRYQQRMNDMARTDQLTGLLNRRGFDQVLYDALKDGEVKQNGFTVGLFDIDDFKKLNDAYGHLFGDKIISQLAAYARKSMEGTGTAARWGGDEFALIIYEDMVASKKLMTDMVESIASDSQFKEYGITVSVGLTASRYIDTPDIIMGRADKSMYRSKNRGKNQISVESETDHQS